MKQQGMTKPSLEQQIAGRRLKTEYETLMWAVGLCRDARTGLRDYEPAYRIVRHVEEYLTSQAGALLRLPAKEGKN